MIKTAFVFSGQGSQYPGMGKELYDNFETARKVFDLSNDVLGMDIRSICFNAGEAELSQTEITQPAILATSIAILQVLREYNISADYAAGLSLGEYSALIAAEVFSYDDGLKLIQKRGKIMQEAVPGGKGAMSAIMGLERKAIEECCMSLQDEGIVEVANYNCPGQIVITGEKEAVARASEMLKAAGALKTVMLNVSGPFHSSMMRSAGDMLEEEIKKVQINAPKLMVISNYDNKYYCDDTNDTINKLKNQISASVKWEDNINTLIGDGVETYIEVGPGRTLTNFVRKINKSVKAYNVEDMKSLEKLLNDLNK